MSAVVLATAAWTYVIFTYLLTVGLIVGYAVWTARRGRKVGAQLPPEDRRWM